METVARGYGKLAAWTVNWDDTDQKWSIIKLAGDDLTLGVARTSSGGKAELVWKRAE